MPAVRAYRHVLCSSLALGQLTDRQIDLRMEGGMALFMMASPLIGERSSARRDTMEVLLVNGNRARPAWHAFIAMSDLFFFSRWMWVSGSSSGVESRQGGPKILLR